MKKAMGWGLLIYSVYSILYGQLGRAKLRFTHSPFYYLSFPLFVAALVILWNCRRNKKG